MLRPMIGFAFHGPLLFAHRGSARQHVENTLPAFEEALQLGADVLELDVHMSADGQVVVSHDADGARLAGCANTIRTTPLAELQRWCLQQPAGAGNATGTLATLQELLERFPDAPLNIDIKQEHPDMVPALLALLTRHGATARVLLTSFSARTLWRVKRLGYAGPVGVSQLDAVRVLLGPRRLTQWLGAPGARLQIPTSFGPLDLSTRARIERAHALGLRVDYWVVDDLALAERLLDLGADGIVTGDCGALATLFCRHVRTSGYRERHARAASSR